LRADTTPIKKDPPRPPQISVTPETPTPTNRPAAARPAAQITDLKAKGIVECKGRGKPPVANDIWVDNTRTKKKSMLCSNFVTLGYCCRFGKECGFSHFRSLKDLPEGPRAAYKAFINPRRHSLILSMPAMVSKPDPVLADLCFQFFAPSASKAFVPPFVSFL
jgi:hypothetical protein